MPAHRGVQNLPIAVWERKRLRQEREGVVPGLAREAALQVADRAGADTRTLGQLFLRQPRRRAIAPEQWSERGGMCWTHGMISQDGQRRPAPGQHREARDQGCADAIIALRLARIVTSRDQNLA
jgi:hypothetical protein